MCEISATDEEKRAAFSTSKTVRRFLDGRGWPPPRYTIDSGNGYWLQYRFAGETDDATTATITDALKALDARFGAGANSGAEVDSSIATLNRLIKIPGTMACKGDNLAEYGRIHRLSAILDENPDALPVTLDQIAELAAQRPRPSQEQSTGNGSRQHQFDLERWIAAHDVPVLSGPVTWDGGPAIWTIRCIGNSEHSRGEAFVGILAGGAISAGCHHKSCAWTWPELRKHFEPERPNPSQGYEVAIRAESAPVALHAPARQWPAPIDEAGRHGLAGELVELFEAHTEADPAAVLFQFLVSFGNCAGRNRFYRAGGVQHFSNLFAVLAGATSRGRKGTSFAVSQHPFREADLDWATKHIAGGLSSGEGLIWAVRDAIMKREVHKEKGRIVPGVYDTYEADAGVTDKRLLIFEPEFSSVLQVAGRDKNTLSETIRRAWDSSIMRTLTKNSPAVATDPHISIIAHITFEELTFLLNDVSIANGLGNRFLWAAIRRSKELPFDSQPPWDRVRDFGERLSAALRFAKKPGEVRFDAEARQIWIKVYSELSADQPGLLGALLARSEAQVVRLALIYALLDSSHEIRPPHLRAALAVWEFSERSAKRVFGDKLGNPDLDAVLSLLRNHPEGVTRTEIHAFFNGHWPNSRLDTTLAALTDARRARSTTESTSGRPTERWFVNESEQSNG